VQQLIAVLEITVERGFGDTDMLGDGIKCYRIPPVLAAIARAAAII
jgi:hypothetical protein